MNISRNASLRAHTLLLLGMRARSNKGHLGLEITQLTELQNADHNPTTITSCQVSDICSLLGLVLSKHCLFFPQKPLTAYYHLHAKNEGTDTWREYIT